MSKEFYVVSMELGTKSEAVETWPGWGGSYNREEAIAIAKELKKEINNGKWDERKKDGYILQMCVDVLDDETLDLLSIIRV